MLWMIVVGIIAGWLAGQLMKGSGYGILLDLVLGLCGGLIGSWVVGAFGLSGGGGLIWSILVATLGAVILVALVRLIAGRRVAA